MPLNPPLCLEAYFQNTAVSGNDYTTTLSITPQTYQSGGSQVSYNGTNVAVGMYATSSLYGYVFKIKSISSQSGSVVVAVLEDVGGLNKKIDPSGGIDGGGPLSGRGYIFELNENGLPALTAINNAPTITFPDSILGRFIYDQVKANSVFVGATGPLGPTGATGAVGDLFLDTGVDRLYQKTSSTTWTNRYDLAQNSVFVGATGPLGPTGATGAIGDLFLDTGSDRLYQKTSSTTWTNQYAFAYNSVFVGATGSVGPTGATGAAGDLFLDNGNNTLYRKSAITGNWTHVYDLGSATGPVAYNSDAMVVAVGSGTSTVASTIDGINWRRLAVFSGTGSAGRCVAWNGSIWVVGGNGTFSLFTSTNGTNWTSRTCNLSTVNGVAWNGSLWVAVGTGLTNTLSVVTSPDGLTWTNRGQPLFVGNAVAWNGLMWVMVGYSGTDAARVGPYIATSYDGITWVTRTIPTDSNFNTAYSVAWNGSYWLVGGGHNGTSIPTSTILRSTDGITWTRITVNPMISTTVYRPIRIKGLAWNGNTWIATGFGPATTNTGIIIQSNIDNIDSWSFRDTTSFPVEAAGVTWNGNAFYAVGSTNATDTIPSVIYSRSNGVGWVATNIALFTNGYGIASRKPLPFVPEDKTNSSSKRLVFSDGGGSTGPMVICPTFDIKTGFSFPATGAVSISTNDIERFRMTASGAQIVRTPQPSNYTLSNPGAQSVLSVKDHVAYESNKSVLMEIGAIAREAGNWGTVYKYQLGFENVANGPGGSFVINGIPTASGNYNSDGATFERLKISPTGNFMIDGSGNVSNAPTRIVLGPAPSTANLDYCSMIQSTQDVASGFSTNLSFWTHNGASAVYFPTERLRIDNAGNTTIFQDASAGVTNHLAFSSRGNRRWAFGLNGATDTGTGTTASGADLNLYSYFDNGSYRGNPITIIRDTGRVGLGTAGPSQTLDVNGTIRGLGSVVNVIAFRNAFTSTWTAYGPSEAVVILQLFNTKQTTGNVTLVINASVELGYSGGAGTDNLEWQIRAGNTGSISTLTNSRINFVDSRVEGRGLGANTMGQGTTVITVSATTQVGVSLVVLRGGDDSSFYRNAHMVIYELSNR